MTDNSLNGYESKLEEKNPKDKGKQKDKGKEKPKKDGKKVKWSTLRMMADNDADEFKEVYERFVYFLRKDMGRRSLAGLDPSDFASAAVADTLDVPIRETALRLLCTVGRRNVIKARKQGECESWMRRKLRDGVQTNPALSVH